MSNEYWFYFDVYARGRRVGRSRVFKIVGKGTRKDACRAAEEEWLATGALAGDSYELLAGAGLAPDMYTLREHDDSPTKE